MSQSSSFSVGLNSEPKALYFSLSASSIVITYLLLRAIVTAFFLTSNQPTLIDEALSAILSVFALASAYRWTRRFLLLLFCLFSYIAVTLLSNLAYAYGGVPQPIASLADLVLDLKFFVCFLGFFYLLRVSKNKTEQLKAFAGVLIFLALGNAIFVLRDILVGGGVGIHGNTLVPRLGTYQPTGFWFHQFDSALCTMFGAYAAIFLWLELRTRKYLYVAIVLMAVLLAHLSAKEVISAILAVSILLLWPPKKKMSSKVTRIFLGAIAAALIIASPISDLVESQLDAYVGAKGDQQARTVLTTTSFKIAQDHFPFGSGGGTYASPPSYQMGYSEVYASYGLSGVWGLSQAKSNFITDVFWPKILAQSGIFGLFAFILAITLVVVSTLFKYVKLRGNALWLSAAVAISSLVSSTSATPFSNEQYFVVLAFLTAYAATVPWIDYRRKT